jgi:hypothetical protein
MQHYIQSISSFDTWPNQKKTIHNAMAMLAPAATAPTLRGVPSHTVSLSSFGRGVRGQKAVGG